MKWFLNKDFAIPFGFGLMLGRFIDVWLVLASAVFLVAILFLVEWLLKRKNMSFHFPSKDFLILSVLVFYLGRFVDSVWLLPVIMVLAVCVLFLTKWLLKRKMESKPEEV